MLLRIGFTVPNGLLRPIKEADFHALYDPTSCQQTLKNKIKKKKFEKQMAGRQERFAVKGVFFPLTHCSSPATVKR